MTAAIIYDDSGRPLKWCCYRSDQLESIMQEMGNPRYVVCPNATAPISGADLPRIASLHGPLPITVTLVDHTCRLTGIPSGAVLEIDGVDVSSGIENGMADIVPEEIGTYAVKVTLNGYDDFIIQLTKTASGLETE